MKTAIQRFITLDPRNIIPEVYIGLLFIYAALLLTTLNSIRSNSSSRVRKFVWALLILFLPIGGMAIYAISCLVTADHSFLRSIGLIRSTVNSKSI